MLADDLEYGWYKWEDGCRQKDGFFVDRIGRVLFWPEAKGPGYVLDDATAERIGGRKKREIEKKKEEEAEAEIGGAMAVAGGALTRLGVPAMPIFIVILIFKALTFVAERTSSASDGDPVSNGETATQEDAPESEEGDEVGLSRCRQDGRDGQAFPLAPFMKKCAGAPVGQGLFGIGRLVRGPGKPSRTP